MRLTEKDWKTFGRENLPFLAIVIIALLMLSFLYTGLMGNTQEETFLVRFEGSIQLDAEDRNYIDTNATQIIDKRPSKVRVYTYRPKTRYHRIPSGEKIGHLAIDWENQTTGHVSGSVEVPFETRLTIYPAGGPDYQVFNISREQEFYSVNLIFDPIDRPPLDTGIDIGDNPTSARREAKDLYEAIDYGNLLNYENFSEASTLELYEEQIQDKLRSSRRAESENESYRYALQAHWYALASHQFFYLAEWDGCLQEANRSLEKFNPLYFTPPAIAVEKIEESKDEYQDIKEELTEDEYLIEEITSVQGVKREISQLSHIRDDTREEYDNCREAGRILEDSLELQKDLKPERQLYLIFWAVVLLSLGIVGGIIAQSRLSVSQKIENFGALFYPSIDEEFLNNDRAVIGSTILIVGLPTGLLSISSSLSRIVSVSAKIAFFYSLGSVLLVLIGVWNNDNKWKTWGLAAAIIGVIYLLMGPGIITFSTAISDATTTFLGWRIPTPPHI